MRRASQAGERRAVPQLEGLEERLVLSGVSAQQGPFPCTVDLMLVLDGSGSLTAADFDLEKQFVTTLISEFVVDPQYARVGIVQFSSEGQTILEIGLSDDAAAIDQAIVNMVQLGGLTDIQEGLAFGQQEIAANGRPGVPHVLVLVTASNQDEPGDPVAQANAIKAEGTLIFSVGVGLGVNVDTLDEIASQPPETFVFLAQDFTDLQNLAGPLAQQICAVVGTGPIVTDLVRYGYHAMPTQLVMTFDQPMDVTSVENTDNYILVWLGHDRQLGTHDDVLLPIDTATYDADTLSVTVVPKNRLPIRGLYQLIVVGAEPNGLRSETGTFLDGSGLGQPGTDYVQLFGPEILVRPTPRHDQIFHAPRTGALGYFIQRGLVPLGPLRQPLRTHSQTTTTAAATARSRSRSR